MSQSKPGPGKSSMPAGAPSRRQSPRSEKVAGMSVDPAPPKPGRHNKDYGPVTPGGWSAMRVARAHPEGYMRQLDMDAGLRLDFEAVGFPGVGLRAWVPWSEMSRAAVAARPGAASSWSALLASAAEHHCKYKNGIAWGLSGRDNGSSLPGKADRALRKGAVWMESELSEWSCRATARPAPRPAPPTAQSQLAVEAWRWSMGKAGQTEEQALAARCAVQARLSAMFGPRALFEQRSAPTAPEAIQKEWLSSAILAWEMEAQLGVASEPSAPAAPRRRSAL